MERSEGEGKSLILCRFRTGSKIRWGVVRKHGYEELVPHPFEKFSLTGIVWPARSVELCAPCAPTKIVAIGVNYEDHAKEFNKQVGKQPLIFLKPPSAVIGPGGTIRRPSISKRVDYEGELAVVIGRRASRVKTSAAVRYILGYTIMNDVTARDLQRSDGQWSRAKGFDTFAPLGPWIATEIDPGNLKIETRVNGRIRQSSRTSRLIFPVNQLVSHISHVMTLEPGDVISTGTPSGVGPLKGGDKVEVKIERIGRLVSYVR